MLQLHMSFVVLFRLGTQSHRPARQLREYTSTGYGLTGYIRCHTAEPAETEQHL